MRVAAVLFDYGGTLDGEGWHWFDRFVHLYRGAGSTLPLEAIREAYYFADREIAPEARAGRYRLRPLLERHVELQAEVLGEPTRRIARALVDGFAAISDVGWRSAREALGALRGRVALGVVSNFYGNLSTLLDEAGLAAVLDTVIESARVGLEKPDPAIYRLAAKSLALPPERIVMVGDNFERDCRPAKAIGMSTVWLRRGEAPAPEPGIADRVVSRLAEICPAGDPA